MFQLFRIKLFLLNFKKFLKIFRLVSAPNEIPVRCGKNAETLISVQTKMFFVCEAKLFIPFDAEKNARRGFFDEPSVKNRFDLVFLTFGLKPGSFLLIQAVDFAS